MKLIAPNINYLWAELIVEELVRCGVTFFCIAPGSRSSPLAVAAGTHRRATSVVHFDERGLAFHALGWARATGRPAAVITTSGTAVANLAPAMAEACCDRVPLLALTADRPPELRETGANQTMDQVKLFATFVRWQFDLPCPDDRMPVRSVLTAVDQAVHRATRAPAGPVHLNCMLREPLAPTRVRFERGVALEGLDAWLRGRRPLTQYEQPVPRHSRESIRRVVEDLQRARRGVVLVGPCSPDAAAAAAEMAQAMKWPLLPDIRSGLRTAVQAVTVHHADLLLGSAGFSRKRACDAVLHVGGRPVSRRLAEFCAAASTTRYVHVAEFPDRLDPSHRVTHRLEGDSLGFCEAVRAMWPRRRAGTAWLRTWIAASRRAAAALAVRGRHTRTLDEPWVAWEVSRSVPADHALFLGNSLPVRLIDAFAVARDAKLSVAGNRGVSGIDGVLASAAGYASGAGRPVTLVLGDLSLLHDLNSLAMLARGRPPVTVIVINNDGGGIFSFLPVAESAPAFERLFGTPHGCTFAAAAKMFGLGYENAASPRAFVEAYARAVASGRSSVLEVSAKRADTVRAYRRAQQLVARAVGAR